MSVSGISSSSLFDYNTQSVQNRKQQFQQEFQQLGQDLQSGNLSAAQADFATLQQLGPQTNSTSSSQSSNAIAQEFSQLSQDLQSGNVSAAQKDYSTIQQDFQTHAGQAHHHHHGGGGSGESAVSQLLSQLGQALQSGNLSAAQQAYSTLQQDFQQFTQTNASNSTSASSTVSNSVAVNA
jgi:outer membrane protein assembly factor BamD (BamD/ComL family)